MNTTEQTIKEIFRALFSFTDTKVIESLSIESEEQWDSMKQLSIITAIENEFDIFIDASEASKLSSYQIILEFLKNHPDLE